jgi:hypothetical protein
MQRSRVRNPNPNRSANSEKIRTKFWRSFCVSRPEQRAKTVSNPNLASSPLLFNFRIKVFEFYPCIGGTELPVDSRLPSIARLCLLLGKLAHSCQLANALIQALARQHAQLRLGHVEPTAMLRCMHQLNLARQP